MKQTNWQDDGLIETLKKATIRTSLNRKFKKVFIVTISIVAFLVAAVVGILVYNLNKPFDLQVITNLDHSSLFNLEVEKRSRISNLKVIEIEGFEFIGWYKDENFEQPYDEADIVTEDTALYAAYKVKQFYIEVPLHDSYSIDLNNISNIVDYGEDFEFTLYANSDYDITELQILLNGELLRPISADKTYATYRITDIKYEVVLEVEGSISKFINLNVYVDGVLNTYKVKDTSSLQNFFTSLDNPYTEYNTIGLFTDSALTIPANLSQRITNNVTVYTKQTTSTGNFIWSWNSASKTWSVNISKTNLTTSVLPSKYKNGASDGYVSTITGTVDAQNNTLLKVYLPSNVTTIDNYAFYNFTKLEEISLPKTITTINNSAFQNNEQLKSVTLSNGLMGIGNFAFDNCKSLSRITIPNTVTVIGYYAVRNCTAMKSVSFENNSQLTTIGGMAFAYSGIQEIEIPYGVTIIGDRNFYYCENLTKVTLPSTISIISSYAFYYCKKLTEINLTDNITIISSYAFYNCTKLSNVHFSNSLTEISSYSFGYCTAFKNIYIPDNIKTIGSYAFTCCGELEQVRFPTQLTAINAAAFTQCSKLKSIEIPATVTTLGNSAFSYCKALTQVVIPANVKSFGSSVFAQCTNLVKITFNNNVLKTLSSSSFSGCEQLSNVILPNSLTSISDNLFYNCKSLTSVVIPSGVTTISTQAFEGCINLQTITFNDKLTTLGSYAFQNCTSLTTITIPKTVTSVGYSPFIGCTSLVAVNLGVKDNYKWITIKLDTEAQGNLNVADSTSVLNFFTGKVGVYKFQQIKN